MNLVDKAVAFTSEKGLFSAPCHILVGVSGGADSMALLHLLLHWPADGLQVSAVHIHHGLREDTADRDEAFVREYCMVHHVPLTVIHEDVIQIADEEHLTLEEAGRQVRYAHFEAVRHSIGADYAATAHTASDQVETMLMHIVRGCGLDGLVGIPAARGYIRRPLLCCTREEIEEYCAENKIPFIEDETNRDTRFTRNYIRHRVLPMLREMNPAVDQALLRMRDHAEMDASYIYQTAQVALNAARCDGGYAKSAFQEQSSVIRRRMIRILLSSVDRPNFEEVHILAAEQAVLRGRMSVSLPNGLEFNVSQDVVCVRMPSKDSVPTPQTIDTFPAEIVFGKKTLRFERFEKNEADPVNVHNLFLKYAVDCDKIKGKLCVRGRLEGDYMHPSGRGIGKSLKKLMNEWRIFPYLRNAYPILCDDSGVLLVPEYAVDERVRITESTKHYLVCRLIEE